MKGAFSRLVRGGGRASFRRVLLQQGRVLLDADWNDFVEIVERELRERTRMIIGEIGGPQDRAGFELRPLCGIRLNCSDQGDQHYGQWIEVRPSRTLPFAGDYTIALEFCLPAAGACRAGDGALLLAVDGLWSVTVNADNCLELDTGAGTRKLGQVEGETRWLLVVSAAGDGLTVWSHAAASPPRVRVSNGNFAPETPGAGRVGVHVAGSEQQDDGPCCTIDGLWIWAEATEDPPRYDNGELILHDCALVCDLDMTDIEAPEHGASAARIDDTSGNENYGWIRTVEGSKSLPPVVLTEALALPGVYFIQGALAESASVQELALPSPGQSSTSYYQFYLELRERFITALQDQQLLEPALGDPGPDTTARTELLPTARVLRADSSDALEQRWNRLRARYDQRGQARFQRDEGSFDAGNRLYRVEIHSPGWARPAAGAWSSEHASPITVRDKKVEVQDPELAAMLQLDSPVAVWGDRASTSAPTIARVICIEDDGRFELSALPQPREQPCLLPLASFKWSRDNGCLAYPVESISLAPSTPSQDGDSQQDGGSDEASAEGLWIITLSGYGYNGLDIAKNEWLEFVNDELELDERGGSFFRVVDVDFSVDLKIWAVHEGSGEAPTGELGDLGSHPIVRRWDIEDPDDASDTSADGLPAPLSIVDLGSSGLEQGLDVEFAGDGFYAVGDWWVAPVRDAVDVGLLPSATIMRPPQGIERWLTKLAVLETGRASSSYHDERRLYAPLASERGPAPSPAPAPQPAPGGRAEIAQTWIEDVQILVAEGETVEGLVGTGEHVAAKLPLTQAEWSSAVRDNEPSGPGDALMWGNLPVFLGRSGALAYSPERAGWRALPSLPQELGDSDDFVATSVGPVLWALGTGTSANNTPPSAHYLHRGAPAWKPFTKLETTIHESFAALSACIVSLGDKIHLVGGRLPSASRKDPSEVLATHLEIDPRSGAVAELPNLQRARADFALVAHDGLLFAIGGRGQDGRCLDSVECWSPVLGEWHEIWPVPAAAETADASPAAGPPAMALMAAASVAEGIVVSGGVRDQSPTSSREVWLFEPGGPRWTRLAPLQAGRSKHGMVSPGDELWVLGGDTSAGGERLAMVRRLQVMQMQRNT
jgi:hypothetical protein